MWNQLYNTWIYATIWIQQYGNIDFNEYWLCTHSEQNIFEQAAHIIFITVGIYSVRKECQCKNYIWEKSMLYINYALLNMQTCEYLFIYKHNFKYHYWIGSLNEHNKVTINS
jgi:hypothetical protein